MKKSIAIAVGSVALFAATPPQENGPRASSTTSTAAVNPSAGLSANVLARIRTRMQEFVDRGTAAGFVTLVARHGHIASVEAVGWQDREVRTLMRPGVMFQIMSMTKPITCAAVMTFVDEGRISINDPVEKFLPEFKGQKLKAGAAPAHPITLRDLMTHTSGVPAGSSKGFDRKAHTLAEVVADAAQQPLEFEPGSKWSYSNNGIGTLGRVLEVLSAKSYE
jgi:CubicO group peptidase (beta-lactamase class C family)